MDYRKLNISDMGHNGTQLDELSHLIPDFPISNSRQLKLFVEDEWR